MKKSSLYGYPALSLIAAATAGVGYYLDHKLILISAAVLFALVVVMAMCALIHQQRAVAVLLQSQTQLLVAVMRSNGVEVTSKHEGP